MSIQQPVYLGQLHKCHQCNIQCHFSASDGYNYMQCARKLFYDKQRGFRTISPDLQKMFQDGKAQHDKVKALLKIKYPKAIFEFSFTKTIGTYILHGHADCTLTDKMNIIEIKGSYSKGAYMQTLMYRLLAPDYEISIVEYINKEGFRIFPLKADLTIAKVYFARLVTASKILAPRLPKYPNCFACNNCDVKDQCDKDKDYQWNDKDIERIHLNESDKYYALNTIGTIHTFKELADQTYKEIFG